jgi:phosphohistidine phosphatase
MDLILWRHAEAREAKPDEDDLTRPLTPRGERHAERMAHWLNRFLPDSTRVLVSPALRARQTADTLGKKSRVLDALAPGATATQLLTVARWPESREPVLLVAHQPSLGHLIALLMDGQVLADGPAWTVRKGAVWRLRHRARQGVPEVVLVSVNSPDRV